MRPTVFRPRLIFNFFMRRLACFVFAAATAGAAVAPAVRNVIDDRFVPATQQELSGILANRTRANIEGYLEQIKPALQPGDPSIRSQSGVLLETASEAYENNRDPTLKIALDKLAQQVLQNHAPDGRVLLGLLAYYSATDSYDAFSAARDMGDSILKNSADQNIATDPGGLLVSLVMLYRFTADDRYLDFCKNIARPETDFAAATVDALDHLRGLIDLYRVTGNESYLKPVTTTWKTLVDNRISITGTVAGQPSQPVEDCVTSSWLRLNIELLRLTGEARYAQQVERSIYNQLFAAQDAHTGRIASALAIAGIKKFGGEWSQCAPEESRALVAVTSTVWGRYGRGIAIMQYTGGRTTFQLHRRGAVQIYSEARYPQTGDILLHVEPGRHLNFALRLRVPEWAKSFTADYAGLHVIGKPGDFIVIARNWMRGDTVKISIAMNPLILERNAAGPSDNAKTHEIAIQRGPQVLALAKIVNPDLDFDTATVSTNTAELKLGTPENKLPPNWPTDLVYSVPGRAGSSSRDLFLLPFADALNYRVWLRNEINPQSP